MKYPPVEYVLHNITVNPAGKYLKNYIKKHFQPPELINTYKKVEDGK